MAAPQEDPIVCLIDNFSYHFMYIKALCIKDSLIMDTLKYFLLFILSGMTIKKLSKMPKISYP